MRGSAKGHAAKIAIGVDWEVRRQVLAVELATGRAAPAGRTFGRPKGQPACFEFVVSDDHTGLKNAMAEVLAGGVLAALCPSCATRSTTGRAGPTTIVCSSSATGVILARCGAIRRPGSARGEKYPKLTGWVEENTRTPWRRSPKSVCR